MGTAEESYTVVPCPSCEAPCEEANMASMAVKCDSFLQFALCDNLLSPSETKSMLPDVAEAKTAERRQNLAIAEVSESNLVCVIGIPAVLADEEILRHKKYFGQYGKILKISIWKNKDRCLQFPSAGSSCNVYVAFGKAEDAMKCIQSLNGYALNGKILKASFVKKRLLSASSKQTGTWQDKHTAETQEVDCCKEQLCTQNRRKRVIEANCNEGVYDCESDVGDNFSCKRNEGKKACCSAQSGDSPQDNCKRHKFDAGKVKDIVSPFNETESSSVESISALTVGTGAISRGLASADHTSDEFALLVDKINKVDANNHEFRMVQNKFATGFGLLASFATIKCIYKLCHGSASGQARLRAFRRQEELTRTARGFSNVRYGWHGSSKAGISVIILHGFGQPWIPKTGAVYGSGVYLAPEDHSHVSAIYSDVDENGEQHMVLCRIIMGNMEQVEQGSEQFHPSSEDYDTGVDDLGNPRHYIVWSTHMNTHILPEYVVSFKLAPPWNDIVATLRGRQAAAKPASTAKNMQVDGLFAESRTSPKTSCTAWIQVRDSVDRQSLGHRGFSKTPRSPWMSFPMLFLVMKAKLSEEQMSDLQRHYLQFKAGKMPRDQLIKVVRSIAGDRLLSDSIRSMQAQEKASSSNCLFHNGSG